MKINLIDNGLHLSFAPLSLTRPIAELRMGIFTNTERYKHFLPECEIGYHTEVYLSTKYKALDTDLSINGNVIPNEDFIAAICNLEDNQSLVYNDRVVAKKGKGEENDIEVKVTQFKGHGSQTKWKGGIGYATGKFLLVCHDLEFKRIFVAFSSILNSVRS